MVLIKIKKLKSIKDFKAILENVNQMKNFFKKLRN